MKKESDFKMEEKRYYLQKLNSLEVHVFSFNRETKECIDVHITLMGVKSVKGYQALNESHIFKKYGRNLYRISRHLFDICVFAYSRGMALPFDISEVKKFASEELKKRYDNVIYEKLPRTELLNGL